MKPKLSEFVNVCIFIVLGLAMIYIVHSVLSKSSLHKTPGYHIKALFRDLRQLQVGDDVRLAGVHVGSVSDTYLENDLAVAILHINNKYPIAEDAVATILMSGLLGANYVAIAPGVSKTDLTDGSLIHTRGSADLSAVINRFGKVGARLDRILSTFDEPPADGTGEPKKSLLANLADFFNQNWPKLNSIIENIDKITTQIADGEGTIGKLIKEDTAHERLMAMMDEIREAATQVQDVLDNLQNGEGVLAKLLSDKKLGQEIQDMVANLHAFSEKLNDEKSTLGRLITSDSLHTKAEDTLSKVDKAVDSLSNNGPMTAVGVAASALF